MNNINFGKDIKKLAEDELFRIINGSDPQFGAVAQFELMRRLTLENSKSSRKYAIWSLLIAITAIIISLISLF